MGEMADDLFDAAMDDLEQYSLGGRHFRAHNFDHLHSDFGRAFNRNAQKLFLYEPEHWFCADCREKQYPTSAKYMHGESNGPYCFRCHRDFSTANGTKSYQIY